LRRAARSFCRLTPQAARRQSSRDRFTETSITLMKRNLLPTLFCFASLAVCRADGPYHFIKEIPVGGEGGWDYLSVDEAGRRLYVSHATKVVVIDIGKDAVAGEIADTPGIHGLAAAPDLQRGITSNGRENKASIVDLKSLKTLS